MKYYQGGEMERFLSTAGGRITCLRCTAKSSRSKTQCKRPALKSSKTVVCQFHGGRGSGPKTDEGKARIATAHTKHGEYSKVAKAAASAGLAKLSQLDDVLYLMNMTSVKRSPGRKPLGYKPVQTINDVFELMFDTLANKP
jgi:hypothetical protein